MYMGCTEANWWMLVSWGGGRLRSSGAWECYLLKGVERFFFFGVDKLAVARQSLKDAFEIEVG